jgi:hypothetical protein
VFNNLYAPSGAFSLEFSMRLSIPLREWSTDRLLAVFHDLWISDNDRKLLAKIYDELERRRH